MNEPPSETAKDYIAFCEKLWRGWLDHELTEPPLTASRFIRKVFDLKAAPEPYICFCAGAKPLLVLTTNPGGTMCHQCRDAVKVGDGPLSEKRKYAEAAAKLGCFYQRKLAGTAGRRIAKLRKLSCWLGYEGVLQVEACPFHSPSLRKKSALLQEIAKKDELLGRYAEHLRAFLRRKAVLSLQAAPTRASLRPETPKSSQWLTKIAGIGELDLGKTEFVPLKEKGCKIMVAAWVSKAEVRKALVLMMGKNDLPGDEGLTRLAAALRKFWRLR